MRRIGEPDHDDALPPRQVEDHGEHDRRESQRGGARAQPSQGVLSEFGGLGQMGRPLRRKNASTSPSSGGGPAVVT